MKNRNTLYIFVIILSWAQLVCAQEGSLKWKVNVGYYISDYLALGYNSTIYTTGLGHFFAINPDSTVQWSINTGDIESNPIVAPDGTIYLGQLQSLQAYNSDSTLKWSTLVYIDPPGYTHISGIALGTDGTIYIGSTVYDSTLRAFTPQGSQKWKISLNETTGGVAVNRKYGTIYASSYDNISCSLSAINPDGTVLWKISTTGYFGKICLDQNGLIYVGQSDGKLYCLYPNGTIKWTYQTGGSVASPVLGEDNSIYFGSQDQYLYALNSNGTLKWKFLTGSYVVGTPAVGNDGVIYFGSYDHYIYALNSDSTLRWKYLTGNVVISDPAISSDGTLYIGSSDLNLYAIYCSSTGLANSPWPRGGHDNQNTNLGGQPTSCPLFPDRELFP